MSYYSELLARQIGLNKNECELILNASPLHDIGKIGIPDHILLKPGKLTEAEFEIMKTHTVIGANMLDDSKSELMDVAKQIAMNHHEKWDGSGYPNGMSGDNIPLYGRIVALCDVFDALTSVRCYKKAWSLDEALAEINKLSGKHFDPDIVQCFMKILPSIRSVMKKYMDEPLKEAAIQ
jgi:putative two-component system response regulator